MRVRKQSRQVKICIEPAPMDRSRPTAIAVPTFIGPFRDSTAALAYLSMMRPETRDRATIIAA
jgi:hypothetical protein